MRSKRELLPLSSGKLGRTLLLWLDSKTHLCLCLPHTQPGPALSLMPNAEPDTSALSLLIHKYRLEPLLFAPTLPAP